jgi:hypothetical protein
VSGPEPPESVSSPVEALEPAERAERAQPVVAGAAVDVLDVGAHVRTRPPHRRSRCCRAGPSAARSARGRRSCRGRPRRGRRRRRPAAPGRCCVARLVLAALPPAAGVRDTGTRSVCCAGRVSPAAAGRSLQLAVGGG